MTIDEESVVFWPVFASKTDRAISRQSGWKLLRNSDCDLDPVHWVKALLRVSASRRSAKEDFSHPFIIFRGKVAAIAGWVRTAFVEAKIDYSPSSIRSAGSSSRFNDNVPSS